MKNLPRLYVVVSNKLNKGKATAQSCHAVAEFAIVHHDKFAQWDNHTIVCLRGNPKDVYETIFGLVMDETKELNPNKFVIPSIAAYHESDMENEMTAVAVLALNEEQLSVCEKLFNDLPLI
jgi:peptidyl-tRNA hydrolase